MSKPRTASLRVAHRQGCQVDTKTTLDSLTACTCQPSYYTFHRDKAGRPVKGPRVRDRQVADRALRKLLVELDEDRADVGPRRRRNVPTFNEWTATYLENLTRDKQNKGSTIRAYEGTFNYAKPIIGTLDLDEVGQPELRLIVREIRKGGAADATVFKHLRHLRATFTAAVEEGCATGNPLTRKFVKDISGSRIPNRVESYRDDEIAKLFAQMALLEYEPVYIHVLKIALATGARIGELVALNWDDVNLTEGTMKIRRHYDLIDGMTSPKSGVERTVHLLGKPKAPDLIDAVAALEAWTALSGIQPGDSPVFPAPRGDRLNRDYLRQIVEKARIKAGIPDVGERGGKRKPLHALRASHVRIARAAGFPTYLNQENLGHSTPDLSERVYGTVSVEDLQAAARGTNAPDR